MKAMRLEQVDGSVWAIPVIEIAINRAEHFAHEYDDDVDRSLHEDTLPLFDADEQQIIEWATGNMNWEEAWDFAVLMARGDDRHEGDYQEGWINGAKEIIDLSEEQVIMKVSFQISERLDRTVREGGKIYQ